MSLRIRGRRRFRRKVLEALGQLCPCNEYVIDDEGFVSAVPLNRDAFCECYCSHRAGCNLLADLLADPRTVTIRRGRNKYKLRDRSVRWSPSRRPRVRTSEGRRRTPAHKVLGHELIHARHHLNGDLDTTGRTNGVLDEEIDTVRGENQLRQEQGEPQRTHYGRRRVPDPGTPNLDASDREDCGCDELLRGDPGVRSEQMSNEFPGAEGPLTERVESARAIRDAARPKYLDRQIAKLAGSPYMLLERVLENEEAYGFILLARPGRRLQIATDLEPRRDGKDLDVVELERPVRHKAKVDGELAKMLDELASLATQPGIGGDLGVFDGSVEFVRRVGGPGEGIFALVGLEYEPVDDRPERVETEPDRARQRTVELVYGIWARVAS